ncbi:MAG: DUF1552 domain-containing protein [Pirellulaceae bacterium]
MSAKHQLDRRNFLRGAGISLALPTLASLAPGQSLAADQQTVPKRLVCVGNSLGYWPDGFFPKVAGKNYQTTQSLKFIDHHRGKFTVFSNLDDDSTGGHSGVGTFLSGIKIKEAAGFPEKNMTLDQRAAEHVGSATRYPSIVTGVGEGSDLCWNRSGVRIPPITNPARVFEALFVQADESIRKSQRYRIGQNASIIDALLENARSVKGKINQADRNKLDQYLTSVRDVEKQLQMSEVWVDQPKPKPTIEPILDTGQSHLECIPLFYQLMALALQTDSTRVASLETPVRLTLTGLTEMGYHGLSHHGKDPERLKGLAKVEAYLLEHFAGFLNQISDVPAEDGKSLLDHTLVVFGSGMGNGSTHSNKRLPVVMAGGGVQHLGHLACPDRDGSGKIPLSNLWLSALQWFGLEVDRFGKSTGTLSLMNLG